MIKLLIVDDSALMRRLLGGVFCADQGFDTAFARDGVEALGLLSSFAPDVITLDVQMPRMDGLTCLDRIMLERPCPVVMVSALTEAGAAATLEAMALGAVDVMAKPTGAISLEMEELGPRLLETVRAAAGARVRRTHRFRERIKTRLQAALAIAEPVERPEPRPMIPAVPTGDPTYQPGERVVVVGTSTGGPPALEAVLSVLPADFPWPVVIAQHMPASFTGSLAARLNGLSALSVVEVSSPMPVTPGVAYIGRGDADLIFSRRPAGIYVMSAPAKAELRWHPSTDRLMDSAMDSLAPQNLIGVLMTGMGYDGAAAMTRLRAQGGRTIAESQETAVIWGMPGELVKAGGAEFICDLDAIAAKLVELAR